MNIENINFKVALGIDIELKNKYRNLGLINYHNDNTLSFIDDIRYLEELNNNNNIKGVFCTKKISYKIKDKECIIVNDPRYYFYVLYNYLGKKNYKRNKSLISKNTIIHSSAVISDYNVVIKDNTIIGANVTILNDVEIGENCVIQPGTVIGSEGFEYKRTSKGILPVFHDGKVIIKDNVEIGANTCIDKGFSIRNTIIGQNTKIDNLVHIAHGVQIGKNNFIIANSMIAGSVTIEDDVWVGPNSSIAPQLILKNKSFITLGSVVTKNVKTEEWVTGNFAIPHKLFLKNLKNSIK